MVTTPWLWVTEVVTSVDTSELMAAAGQVSDALSAGRSASAHLYELSWGPGLSTGWLSEVVTTLDSPLAAEIAERTALVQSRLSQVHEDLQDFSSRTGAFSDWVAQAALIYAAAEEGVAGYARACSLLEGLGCSFTTGEGVGGRLQAGAQLVGALPGMIGDFTAHGGGSRGEAGAGVLLQGHLQSLAGGSERFLSAVVAVATWWRSLGDFASSPSRGILLKSGPRNYTWVGEQGESSPVASFSSDSFQQVGDRGLRQAHSRLEQVEPVREDVRELLAGVGLDASGLPLERMAPSRAQAIDTVVPLTAAALLARVAGSGSSPSVGEVQVLRHSSASSARSWSVVIRGTQEWLPGSLNPQDMQSNFSAVAGKQSDQQRAVEEAMRASGIEPGDPVELVGHSQGGAIALKIAGDPQLKQQFNIVSVLTAGAPTARLGGGVDAAVLNLESIHDLVPALDGMAADRAPSTTTVLFDSSSLALPEGKHSHDLGTYVAAAAQMGREVGVNPMVDPVGAWEEQRRSALGFEVETRTETLYFQTTRVR
ncbi:hypothetical protein [Actinomyces minihominis]|uniref:hypothetical protein n=1 Tax=Actinomyces minihominis TaxID=2002838 RepID=UPI000C07EE97|nr:hypothetical protein [Actinomyces minihominis]